MNEILPKLDKVCTYIPIVSNITNIVDLYLKNVYIKKHYYSQTFDYLWDKKNRRCVALACCPIISNIFFAIYDGVRKEKTDLIASIKKNFFVLKDAKEKFKNDPEVLLEAIRVNSQAAEYASDALKKNKPFALEAIKVHDTTEKRGIFFDNCIGVEVPDTFPPILKFLCKELQDDKDVVLASVKKKRSNGEGITQEYKPLYFASDRLKNDEDVVLAAVKERPLDLKHASDRLRGNKSLILDAISSHCLALEHASDELKKDKDVVIAAIASFERARYTMCSQDQERFEAMIYVVLKNIYQYSA